MPSVMKAIRLLVAVSDTPTKERRGGGGATRTFSSAFHAEAPSPPSASTPARHSNTQICKHIDRYNWKRQRNHGRAGLKMFITLSSQRQRVYSPPAQCWTNSEISAIFLDSGGHDRSLSKLTKGMRPPSAVVALAEPRPKDRIPARLGLTVACQD